MRLWSIHPSHLDVKGLLAVWREGLLAQKVLRGKTKGYRNHPQLERFRKGRDPVGLIGAYLSEIHRESERRGYSFNRSRIVRYVTRVSKRLTATSGQVRYEKKHLLLKLNRRDKARHSLLLKSKILLHPLFKRTPGGIASWERFS